MDKLFKIIAFILMFGISNILLAQTFTEVEAKLKKVDYVGAYQELLPLIEQGNAHAQNLLGELYNGYYGDEDEFEQNIAEAEKWYKLAAEQNLTKAQLNLGKLYKDIADRIYMFALWRMPFHSEGSEKIEQDLAHLAYVNEMWCRLAIEQGNTEVKQNTNMLDKYRPAVDNEIYREALKWFKKSTDQNDAEGQYNLCSMYAGGLGVKKDFKEAIKWCKLALKQDYDDAQEMLQYIEQTQQLCSDKKLMEEYQNQHKFFNKPDC